MSADVHDPGDAATFLDAMMRSGSTLSSSGTEILGKGVYGIAEAARLTRLRRRRVREWFSGRDSPSKRFRPVFQSDYPFIHNEHAISFLDLIELKIGGNLREMGISLPYLRKVYRRLEADFGEHPFCTREIYVGDRKIFTRGLDERESRSVLEALTNQTYFDSIILPFLQKLDYDAITHLAARWHIAELIVVDPAIQFGKPIVEEVGISTTVLRDAYFANNQDAAFVAGWFGVEERHVVAAVRFEAELAA